MIPYAIQDIKKWLELIANTSEERDQNNYNKIISLEGFEKLQSLLESKADEGVIKKSFLDVYLLFCNNIARLKEEERIKLEKEKTAPIADSYTSCSYLGYLLDYGYSIVADLLRQPYQEKDVEEDLNSVEKVKKEIADRYPIYPAYKTAREILERKRNALFNYANPFDNLLNELLPESEKVRTISALL